MQYNTGAAARTRSRCGRRASASTGTSPATSSTQVRGGTGVFTGQPPYVWISNQIGNTGVLHRLRSDRQHDDAARSTRTRTRYKPTNVDRRAGRQLRAGRDRPDFKFPQIWRTNIGVDRRLPWGIIGTAEFLYNKDVNGIYYNANLPAAQSAFTGADSGRAGSARRAPRPTPPGA